MYQISGLSLKNCDRQLPDIRTDIQRAETGETRSKPKFLVSGHYWFVKQYWLVNITGLYRVQVSEKYQFLPQRFNSSQIKAEHKNTVPLRSGNTTLIGVMHLSFLISILFSVKMKSVHLWVTVECLIGISRLLSICHVILFINVFWVAYGLLEADLIIIICVYLFRPRELQNICKA